MNELLYIKRNTKWQLLILLMLGTVFIACKKDPKTPVSTKAPVITTFYLIRHAEKDRSNPENNDPELTQDGLGRAMLWANVFDTLQLDAIYSTDYKRTRMTAAPASVKHNIEIQLYNPNTIDTKQLLKENFGGNVLIVGHSNTTPALANKLIGKEKYEPMSDDNNGNIYIVKLADSTGQVAQTRVEYVQAYQN
ncbi:SixA phosphatase family protein [Croceivirga sp. JEA036]|uniref:SixA phosphatase family protein n=1 Tax=Croceivirga sp. JEA036 TaxID=2721162 RepID=UPI00143C984F|nr:phosphoglycerate mutase family protein [Croceivirga sp. JEA036]NJB35847.1 histidine phosphatase family protein [Croceivirga sp. JEA036]